MFVHVCVCECVVCEGVKGSEAEKNKEERERKAVFGGGICMYVW